jgi:hypothetical protein
MEENRNLETLGGLCSHMLSSPMPVSDDVRECLTQLCVRPTCAAYIVFGMIQKAAKGDTSAAKFIKEINGEGASLDDTGISDLRSLSDVVLCRLAGFTLEKLMQSEM